MENPHSHHPVLVLLESLTTDSVLNTNVVNFHIGAENTFNCPYASMVDYMSLNLNETGDNETVFGEISRISNANPVANDNMNEYVRLFERASQNEPSSSNGAYTVEAMRRATHNARMQLNANRDAMPLQPITEERNAK